MTMVQGFHANLVTGKQQSLTVRVENSQGKHPVQLLQTLNAVLLVEMYDHLGVAQAGEPVAPGQETGTQFGMVVYFPIHDHVDAAVLVRCRLSAAVAVDDGQPPARQAGRYRGIDPDLPLIRPPMPLGFIHSVESGPDFQGIE